MKKVIMLSGLLALLYHSGCTSRQNEEKEEASIYTVTSPILIDTAITKEYVSQIQSVRNVELRAQEKGFLQQIFVDEGQAVKAGQLLFKIMPKFYEAELSRAEAETKSSEIELRNTKLLSDKNIVSQNELSMAEARLDKARAEKALAKLHLSFTEIRAPFDGIIDRIPKKVGSLIDEGELLTSLSDNTQMFAYFNVSEPEYLDYSTNLQGRGDPKVRLLLANNQLFSAEGNVETIESEFNRETGNIAFRARFANANKILRNGQTGKIKMSIPLRHALVIPQKATYEIQDKLYVFVVDRNNVLRSRNILIGGAFPDLYIVSNGLSARDKILLEGVQKVKDDDKIKYEYEAPAEVISHLKLKSE
jgi:membrane fusion protein (multidrug efflux system)